MPLSCDSVRFVSLSVARNVEATYCIVQATFSTGGECNQHGESLSNCAEKTMYRFRSRRVTYSSRDRDAMADTADKRKLCIPNAYNNNQHRPTSAESKSEGDFVPCGLVANVASRSKIRRSRFPRNSLLGLSRSSEKAPSIPVEGCGDGGRGRKSGKRSNEETIL